MTTNGLKLGQTVIYVTINQQKVNFSSFTKFLQFPVWSVNYTFIKY